MITFKGDPSLDTVKVDPYELSVKEENFFSNTRKGSRNHKINIPIGKFGYISFSPKNSDIIAFILLILLIVCGIFMAILSIFTIAEYFEKFIHTICTGITTIIAFMFGSALNKDKDNE